MPTRGARGSRGGEADTNNRDQTETRGVGPQDVAYVCVFLGNIRRNLVVIFRVDGICGQRTSCGRSSLFCFLPFPLPIRPCLGGGGGGRKNVYSSPNPLSAALEVTTCDTDNVKVGPHL